MIGSGVYVDDIDAAARHDATVIGLAVLLATGLLCGVVLTVRRGIITPLARMTSVLDDGHLGRRLEEGSGRAELDRLAVAVNGTLGRRPTRWPPRRAP